MFHQVCSTYIIVNHLDKHNLPSITIASSALQEFSLLLEMLFQLRLNDGGVKLKITSMNGSKTQETNSSVSFNSWLVSKDSKKLLLGFDMNIRQIQEYLQHHQSLCCFKNPTE